MNNHEYNTNKCVPDTSISSPKGLGLGFGLGTGISDNPKLNELFEIPEVKNQIGEYLDCYWCEHGQLINQIIECKIIEPHNPNIHRDDEIRVQITLRKINCGCNGILRISMTASSKEAVPVAAGNVTVKIRCETAIYPIPFRKLGVIEVGVDEVGRGCLFGPVTSGAVIWPPDLDNETTRRLIRDSKKLSESQREEAYAFIIENAISWGVASLDNREIDRTNILRAAIKTMHMAIDETFIIPKHIIADGNSFNIYTDRKGEPVNHTTVIQGDNKYYSIAAASIIAKVTRDRAMIELEKEHPELVKYGIGSNKGYGAPVHLKAIKEHGLTEWHRRSFSPCK